MIERYIRFGPFQVDQQHQEDRRQQQLLAESGPAENIT